jgi:hypothetical protein
MISRLLAPALAATLLVAGCQLPFGGTIGPASESARGSAALHLETQIYAGGFRAQATGVSPYTPDDVTVLVLALFKLDGSTETAVKDAQNIPVVLEVPKASLSESINFTKLWPNTTYRVKATAYADAGKTQVISVAASSSTNIPITQEDRPTVARIKVQLIDKPFDGQGSTSLDIASGSLVPAGSESITVNPHQPG